ncbi:MAG: prepilin-type N-terminal cleavage/methylation domain-containing protein [Planctomycetes bacterium]|nr:prepilin-type N-terminal cleavage/methylation domain-containing protein [Planctomycetota bacterium]
MIRSSIYRYAFTLIELLVVISIILLLSGMITAIPFGTTTEEQIDMAAAQIASTLKQARKLAVETKSTYAVVFHIENSGDSSVFKNYSQKIDTTPMGRHWMAVIGPDVTFDTQSVTEPPIAHNNTSHLMSFKRTIELSTVNKVYLPEGTRFLAISDVDHGNTAFPNGDTGSTYPRPWFGYFDGVKLHPWGAYEPMLDAEYRDSHSSVPSTASTTGVSFEGVDGKIPYDSDLDVCVNPNPTYGKLFPDARQRFPGDDGYGLTDKSNSTVKDDGTSPQTVVGKARAIIDGEMMDYAFIFTGNGKCAIHCSNREIFYEGAYSDKKRKSKFKLEDKVIHTGGFYITVARDIDPDDEYYTEINSTTNEGEYTIFASEEDALDSISPFRRIHIQADTGTIRVRSPYHLDSFLEAKHLLQKDPYPEDKEIPEF